MCRGEWLEVKEAAEEKGHSVAKIRRSFATHTQQECNTFMAESDSFWERIRAGPAAGDIDLDTAADLTATFLAELKTMTNKKENISSGMSHPTARNPCDSHWLLTVFFSWVARQQ